MNTRSELATDIDDVTRQVWEHVLALTPTTVHPDDCDPDDDRVCTVSSSVHIIGGWSGAVSLAMTPDLTLEIASRMFDATAEDLSAEEVDDAVGEMANMIGGNVKSLLGGVAQLSMPTVTRGPRPSFPGTEIAENVAYRVAGHPFRVTLHREHG